MGRLLSLATRRATQAQIRHLTPVPPARAEGLVARVYAQLVRDFGMLAPPVSLHAAAPGPLAASWLMLRETLLAAGPVERAEREAVAVAVSHTNACPYCVDIHATALHGLVAAADAVALAENQPGHARHPGLRHSAGWAASGGIAPGGTAPDKAPHLIGTAVTFHYLNRMVNAFLVERPLPVGLSAPARRAVRRIAGVALGPSLRRRLRPGESLELLPPAPLPEDLSWAAADPSVAGALARAAAACESAGASAAPVRVREVVAAALSDWDGEPAGPDGAPVPDLVAGLPESDRPAGRLALLMVFGSYRVTRQLVDEVRAGSRGDRAVVELAAWASMAAARWWGARLWSYADRPAGR